MKDLENITAEEVAWLVKAVIKTAKEMGEPVDFEKITAAYVTEELTRVRNINSTFEKLSSNAKDINTGNLDKEDILQGVFTKAH
jgi:hypothetical protein